MRSTLIITAGLIVGISSSGLAQVPGQHQPGAKPDHMRHRFDDVERYAKSFDDPARDAWQMPERVVEALALRAGQSVADIGAGTGYFTMRLARVVAPGKVFAVDVEPKMVDYVRQRAHQAQVTNVVPVHATSDASRLPEAVDVILVVDTYHHIPGRVAYFSALKPLIKPEGRLVIIDFKKGAPGGGPPDEFRFTVDEIDRELERAGLVRAAQHDFLPRQHFLVYQAR